MTWRTQKAKRLPNQIFTRETLQPLRREKSVPLTKWWQGGTQAEASAATRGVGHRLLDGVCSLTHACAQGMLKAREGVSSSL